MFRTGFLLFLVLALQASCANITKHTYNDDEFLRIETKNTPPKGKEATATAWRFEGDVLVVDVDKWKTCHRYSEKVFHRTQVTEKKIESNSLHGWDLGVGIVLAGLGAWFIADPFTFTSEAENPEEEDKEVSSVPMGIAGAAAGALLITRFIADEIRAIDKKKDLGEIRVKMGEAQPYGCEESVGTGSVAKLVVPGYRKPFESKVDVNGQVKFDIAAVVSQGRLEGETAMLSLGNRVEPIPLLLAPSVQKQVKATLRGAK